MTLAQRVRDQRYAKGWGPDELASRASISRTALYQIESGKTEHPRAATVRRIAEALSIPTEALLGPNLGVVAVPWGGPEVVARTSPAGRSTASDTDAAPLQLRLDSANLGAARDCELERKFRELLNSPLGEGVARILEESHRFLPRIGADAGR